MGKGKAASVEVLPSNVELKKQITLFQGVAIIVGIIIVYTLCALCYAELGASIPQSGGEYVYIKRAFGDYPAFLCPWINFMLICPVGVAALSPIASLYILQPIFPDCEVQHLAERFIAIVTVWLLVIINCRNVKWATRLQVVIIGFVYLGQEFPVADGFQWVQTVKEDLVKCAGEEVKFPLSFELLEEETLLSIHWSYRQDGATEETRVAAVLESQFKSFLDRDVTQVKEGDAAIKLSDLTTADSGRYTVVVHYIGGTREAAQQTANLTVAEIPETESGALTLLMSNQSESDTSASATNGYQQLLCGRFTNHLCNLGDGLYLESSSFDASTGYFALDLPKQYRGGKYNCMLNPTSIAYSCLPSDSPLRKLASLKVVLPDPPARAAGMDSGTVAVIIVGVLNFVAITVVVTCVIVFKLYRWRGLKYSPKGKEPDSPDEEFQEPLQKQNGNVTHPDIL